MPQSQILDPKTMNPVRLQATVPLGSVVLVTALSVGEQKAWPVTTVDNGFMLTARASTPNATKTWRSLERKSLGFLPYVGAPTAKLFTTFKAWNTVPCTLYQSYQKTAQHQQSSTWTGPYTARPLPEPASKINGREDHWDSSTSTATLL